MCSFDFHFNLPLRLKSNLYLFFFTFAYQLLLIFLYLLLLNVLAPNQYKPEEVKLDHSPAYPFGIKPTEKKRQATPAPNAYKYERIITKAGPAFTFGYKPDDPNSWANLERHIAFNYSAKRRDSNASAGTYDINEEINSNQVNGGTGKTHNCWLIFLQLFISLICCHFIVLNIL